MENGGDFAASYQKLVDKIDRRVAVLEKMHHQHLSCKLGCSHCCMDYSIFPVEYYTILEKIKDRGLQPVDASEDQCIFLDNNSCMIYEHRPIICRTHGLPLLYTNDEGEWELSACELNFTNFEKQFHSKNSFQQDVYNSELFMLNKAFVELPVNSSLRPVDLIPIRNLRNDL